MKPARVNLNHRAHHLSEKQGEEEGGKRGEEQAGPQPRVSWPQERKRLGASACHAHPGGPGRLVAVGGRACLSPCPAVAMPTPRLCFRMLYLISHVWNSNYVISQHWVAMAAGPTFQGGSHLGRKGGAGQIPPADLNPDHTLKGRGQEGGIGPAPQGSASI